MTLVPMVDWARNGPAAFECSYHHLNEMWGVQWYLSQAEATGTTLPAVCYPAKGVYYESVARVMIGDVLGIREGESGFTLVEIGPHVTTGPIPADSTMLKWARGSVTIPQGTVTVSWSDNAARFALDVCIPVGVHIRPVLPCGPADQLLVDGEPVDEDSIMRRDSREAELCVLPGAAYRFEVVKGA